ncbi:DUF1320 domain-containing protein [Pseudomonas nitroreducens]|uniref:DUF1320 domain-containing protein n=2 Tax=Pseudomonas nitroreducens TaxID=46680 RepID=A0ABS0KP05_PSENT|nr:DUF1320 domain-containing protein [Pseudomonas nitroreducens]
MRDDHRWYWLREWLKQSTGAALKDALRIVVLSIALYALGLAVGNPVSAWPPEEIEIGTQALDVIVSSVNDAQAYIDGFLQQRGYLPLQQRFGIVTGWARAITRYLLHKDRLGPGEDKDPIVRDYRDAVKFLQLTADGKFSLGQDDPTLPPGGGGPQVCTSGRTFSSELLKDF